MWPKIGSIPTYGILYLLGIVLHFVLSWRIARRLGLPRRVWIVTSLCYLVGMTIGAKFLFHLRDGRVDFLVPFQPASWRAGGLWGGLLAYWALAVPAVLLLSKQRAAALDLTALTVPVPWIAAKLGCLCQGCCYGRPTSLPWAITFLPGGTAPTDVPRHPAQLYEVGLMLIILAVFARVNSDRWRGTKLLWFFILYGVGRAALDFLRGDNEHYVIPDVLTQTQVICLLVAVAALLVLASWLQAHGRPLETPGNGYQEEQGHI